MHKHFHDNISNTFQPSPSLKDLIDHKHQNISIWHQSVSVISLARMLSVFSIEHDSYVCMQCSVDP
jgi:uncharacterized protein YqfB (UPF0267 family)